MQPPRPPLGVPLHGDPGAVPGRGPSADPVPDADRLAWAARLRAGSDELDDEAGTLLRDAASAGLSGPAGDALGDLAQRVAGEVRDLSGQCRGAAGALVAEAWEGSTRTSGPSVAR